MTFLRRPKQWPHDKLPWTHFHPASRSLFCIDTCKTCGGNVRTPPLSVGEGPTEHWTLFGLTITDTFPPSQCENCPQGAAP